MIPVKIAKIQSLHNNRSISVVLSDEREERAIAFRYHNTQEWMEMRNARSGSTSVIPKKQLTLDTMVALLQALGGNVEKMEIITVQEDLAYAQLHIRGRDNVLTIVNAWLHDALPLAMRLAMPLAISNELWQRRSLPLTDLGTNREQQLEALLDRSYISGILNTQLPLTDRQPRNFDFSDNLTGWQITGSLPGEKLLYDVQLDSQVTYQGCSTLHVTLQDEAAPYQQRLLHANSMTLRHEGFAADAYRGQRLRLITYCRASELTEGHFTLTISGPRLWPHSEAHKQLIAQSILSLDDTVDWQRQELVVDVPQDASKIEFMLEIQEKGSLWLSAIQLELVDQSVPLTLFYHQPRLAELQNLDFRQGLDGWFFQSRFCHGNTPQDYAYGIESVDETASAHCMYIKAIREEPRSPLRLQQSIELDSYFGKRVRLRGSLKGSGLVEPASLYMRKGAIQGYVEHCIVGTQDWTPCEMTTFLQEGSYQLEIGLLLNGKGQVWLKDLAFEVVE
jgi:bifunctional DNase/RNase